jgi:hypothetical protein
VEIADALNYQTWQFHRNWLSNVTYCLWDNINCAPNSNVIILLDLSMNNIAGPLPPVIGTMHSLQHLSFANNMLSGSLPDFLGNLTNLNFLSLSQNQFTGSVPDSYAAFSQMVEFGTTSLVESLFSCRLCALICTFFGKHFDVQIYHSIKLLAQCRIGLPNSRICKSCGCRPTSSQAPLARTFVSTSDS